ncbi:MAG: hypothetical protein ACXWC9_08145 [Pseudobdellovibrionaceae bacterium]
MTKSILTTALASLVMSQGHAMVVHEWGTFTSLQGSNGKDQIGIYHDDEKLPDFVHGLGEILGKPIVQVPVDHGVCEIKGVPCSVLRDNRITQRMETPVVYFYNDGPVEQSVSVQVGFPLGVISETYPAPAETFPGIGATELTNGLARFDVRVQPLTSNIALPFVEATNIYSHARNVASSPILAGTGSFTEREKFIFYRGVGKFEGSLEVNTELSHGVDFPILKNINPRTDSPIQEMILIHTDSLGRSAFQVLFAKGQTKSFAAGHAIPLDFSLITAPRQDPFSLGQTVLNALVRSGLKTDESQAMVDTWGHGYFRTPGLRILYILAPETLERILPMSVSPRPVELVRTMVGRLEILTENEESEILSAIAEQGTSFDIRILGRFAEAKLRAVRSYLDRHPTKTDFYDDIDVLIARAELQ